MFFPENESHSYALSPTGGYLANIIRRAGDRDIVRIIDARDYSELHRFTIPVQTLVDVAWATDDRLLVSANVPTKFESRGVVVYDDLNIRRLFAIDRDGGNPISLLDDRKYRRTTNRADISNVLPQDPDHILMQGTHRYDMALMKVNIHTGDAKVIEKGASSTLGWDVDHDGVPRIRYVDALGGRYVLIQTRNAKGKWKTLSRVKVEEFEALKPIAASEDPRQWYMASRRDGEDLSAIWLYDIVNETFLQKVSSHPEVDVWNAFVDADGRFSHAVFVKDRAEHVFETDAHARHFKGLRTFFGADNEVDFMDISRDGKRWLVRVSGPKQPGAVYFYDMYARHAEIMDMENVRLSADHLGHVESLAYTARDGLRITGYFTHPSPASGGRAGQAPIVVMPHGGPHARDVYGFDRLAQFLASRGYGVFQPNFRGSRGFGEAFETAGHLQWGRAMQDDIRDGVDHLRARGLAGAGRPAIMGWSYGGYAALMSPVRYPDDYACAASVNGISDLEAMLKADREIFGRDSKAFEQMTRMLGEIGSSETRDASPLTHASVFPVPVLIVAGDADKRVDVEQSRRMASALEAAGRPVTLRVYNGADHGLKGVMPKAAETDTPDDDDPDYANKAMMADLDRFLANCFAEEG